MDFQRGVRAFPESRTPWEKFHEQRKAVGDEWNMPTQLSTIQHGVDNFRLRFYFVFDLRNCWRVAEV